MKKSDSENDAPQNQFVHRMIPTVTAVGLTLGAGACGGSDDPKRPSKSDLRDYCTDWRSCVGESNFRFDSIGDCVTELDDEITYYTNVENPDISKECSDASLKYFNCVVDESSCNSMGEFTYGEDACASEYYSYYDVCSEDDSTSM